MTNTEQVRRAVAEAMGWTDIYLSVNYPGIIMGNCPDSKSNLREEIPELTLDLMHQAEKTLGYTLWGEYTKHLYDVLAYPDKIRQLPEEWSTLFCYVNATALQRAEAFLRVKGLWREEWR